MTETIDTVSLVRTVLACTFVAVELAICDRFMSDADSAGRELYTAMRPLLALCLLGNAYRAMKTEVK